MVGQLEICIALALLCACPMLVAAWVGHSLIGEGKAGGDVLREMKTWFWWSFLASWIVFFIYIAVRILMEVC